MATERKEPPLLTFNSRYINSKIDRITDSAGTRTVLVPQKPTVRIFNFTYYQWEEEDRIDTVAEDYFDDGRLWYVIANANPEILHWAEVPVGTVIRIPEN